MGADLDDYTTPGAYYSVDTNTTATLKNVPSWITTGFRVEVINTTITGWFIQKIYSNHKIQNTTIRLHAGTQYLDWCKSLTNGDLVYKETGVINITVPAGKTADVGVTFSVSYKSVPNVCTFGNAAPAAYLSHTAHTRSTTGCKIRAYNPTSNDVTADIRWYTI